MAERLSQAGAGPLNANVYGGVPDVAVSSWLYGVFCEAFGSAAGLSVIVGQGSTVMWKVCWLEQPMPSVTWT